MIFKIEIEDFWLEDEEVEGALRSHIINTVVHKISTSMKDKIEKQITEKVNEMMKAKLEPIIDIHIENCVQSGVITVNREEVKIADHIKSLFQQDRGWSSINEKVKRYSQEFAKEMKLQYDAAFANRIVSGMKEQGLLKDEVVKILLESK